MSGSNVKRLAVTIFFFISIIGLSIESEFLAIGNIKIVRPEPLIIKRQDLNLTIERNGKVKVESFYLFKNTGKYKIKSTFMFWLDKNILNNPADTMTNVKGKYIRDIKFYSDYKKSKNLRAVINFDENIYEKQKKESIQRDWYAISKEIGSGEKGVLTVNYILMNTDFESRKNLVYSFDLVNNFYNKNFTEILYINIFNKSDKKIDSIIYKNYVFSNVTKGNSGKEHYELLAGNVNLDDRMVINFK